MDEDAIQRAKRLVAEAREGRGDTHRLEAALERSRVQVEALERAAAQLESSLPDQIGLAVQEGLRREVMPVGKNLAEIRGLLNQANRRLEHIEEELVVEKAARLDDLALLVDLVASGWQGVDERLRRLEQPYRRADVVPLHGELLSRALDPEPVGAAS
jgi:chromosome segregation ATPase